MHSPLFVKPITDLKQQARHIISRAAGSKRIHRTLLGITRLLIPCRQARFVFVFGCQRSGTTLLKNLIGLDSFVNDAGEYGPEWFLQVPYGTPNYLRARPFDELKNSLAAERSRIVLLKPLHDSQRIPEFLDAFPDAPAIFAYRHFDGTIHSHLNYYLRESSRRWGTQVHEPFEYVRGILPDSPPTWKNENQSAEVSALLRELWPLATSHVDAYALYWLSRNRHYFDRPGVEDRVVLVGYDRLLAEPVETLRRLSRHLGRRIPPRNALILTAPKSKDAPPNELNPEIRRHCEALHERLVAAEQAWIDRLATAVP